MAAEDPRALSAEEGRRLVDVGEAPRVGDWTLRSSLVRYAQRSPVAASAVLEVLRRTTAALAPYARRLESATVAEVAETERPGTESPGTESPATGDASPGLVELLAPAMVLDRLGDALAAWAEDRSLDAPDEEVRDAVGRAHALLEALGVPRETRPPRRAG